MNDLAGTRFIFHGSADEMIKFLFTSFSHEFRHKFIPDSFFSPFVVRGYRWPAYATADLSALLLPVT